MTTVAVLGGGMVGVCCALELQRRGMTVTLIDRREPGQETSYGNSGVLARSSLMPMNNPGLWKALPKLLSNRTTSLRYHLPFLLKNIRWTAGFLARARGRAFQETTTALDALIRLSIDEHLSLMAQAGALPRLRDNGWLMLYRSEAGFDAAAMGRACYASYGVRSEILDPGALAEMEPSLSPIFHRALWIKDAHSVDNPSALVAAYAQLFADRGGVIRRSDLRDVIPDGSGWSVTDTDGSRHQTDRVVVALGPWAPEFMSRIGIHVPMGFERGYHMHYGAEGNATLARPIYDTAGGYVLSPMEQGLRLTTGVELTDRDAPRNLSQLTSATSAARQAFPLGAALDPAPWMGRRPTLPDSRPIIGEAPGRSGLWLAFGHQHIGFSTGPGTASILADLMTEAAPAIDPAPFRPGRFLH
ncbi:FAD-binding oxidoreductase [Pseudoruegeria sp. SK021]|uniref:NAD(P)/FAD-dependent oxidoreductase n=1 Tax=Pseudoruegeria sp. SK021 TaxID=1933035 RepID=UPI000A22F2E0|nr:FAD-binding oxidoreductase [Pseudoruegeria sp. SK021]OSP56149.1 amino acid dehydrogenase [Pseudoruegeria sp. SK021]